MGARRFTLPRIAERSIVGRCLAGLLAVVLCAGCVPNLHAFTTQKTHHKVAKKPELPPLPTGPQGPVPQISLDSMQAIAPHVTYEGGQLTIVAPNSTLADILRAVRKLTSAEMDIPAGASERVVTNLGPGPAREVVAELLNGSHFNYILLGSPSDSNALTHVILVPKGGPETPGAPGAGAAGAVANASPTQPVAAQENADAAEADSADENADENAEQTTPEPEPPPANGDAAVKTPQQLLQEMQQRQLQQQQSGQPAGPLPGPGGMVQRAPQPPQPVPQQQEQQQQ